VFDDETVYTGYCRPTVVNSRVVTAFQRCYTAIFVVCLGIVVVLYSLIYRSVLRQRHKRQKMKATPISSHTPSVPLASSKEVTTEHDRSISGAQHDNKGKDKSCTEAPTEAVEIVSVNPAAAADPANDRPLSKKRSEAGLVNPAAEAARRNRLANIKTAAMLFVVTLVFTVSFFPSLAMTNYILPYNMVIFYMYFANNVANPIIYSFMNSNFRKRLVQLFCK